MLNEQEHPERGNNKKLLKSKSTATNYRKMVNPSKNETKPKFKLPNMTKLAILRKSPFKKAPRFKLFNELFILFLFMFYCNQL